MNGVVYPPNENRNAPNKGPNNNPSPLAASMYPIYSSLSSDSKELNIAIHAVQFAPAPKPPHI